MVYRVVSCPRCGHPQMTTSDSTLRCRYCGRSTSIARLTVRGPFPRHSEALEVLRELQRRFWEDKRSA